MARPDLTLYDKPALTRDQAAELNARHEARIAAWRAKRANGPMVHLRSLPVGGSHLFPQYRLSSQLSPAIAAAKLSGATYQCARECSLIDGACTGVRVTRTG